MRQAGRLKAAIRDGRALTGTFVKTPHHVIVEVLGGCALDLIALDAEHAPFGPESLDRCLLAAEAANLPCLVRIPAARTELILAVLDAGADGIIVPHVRDAAMAERIVADSRYGPGGRGFAMTNRAGRYGRAARDAHMAQAADVVVIAQIEDREAVDAAPAICAVDGIDAVFIGRSDLSVALGCNSPDDPAVTAAFDRITAAARAANRPVATFVPDVESAAAWRDRGVPILLIGSEHTAIQRFFD